MKDQLMVQITTAIASVGGIAGVITILCTIIKVFGGNSIKARLAASKIELDNTMTVGLDDIERKIVERMNAQISVDITAQIADYVELARKADRETISNLQIQLNAIQSANAELLNAFAELTVLKAETKRTLREEAGKVLADTAKIKITPKPIVQISLKEEISAEVQEDIELEKNVKVVL